MLQKIQNSVSNHLNSIHQQTMSSSCYFYQEGQPNKFLLPLMSNKYQINIVNKFAQIKSIQKYINPFNKSLQIHYEIPVDPNYCLSKLIVKYQNVVLQGTVKQRQKIKAEYKEAKQKGQTVMAVTQSSSESSILVIKIGNIQPEQIVEVQFQLLGQLKCQIQNQWTLRIPSHIGPRYHTNKDAIQKILQELAEQGQCRKQAYIKTKTQWDFKINLNCSQDISSYVSSSHKLKAKILSPKSFVFQLNDQKVPEVDLEFTYSHNKPQTIFSTLGNTCLAVTFCMAPSQYINFDMYKGQYIFILDRSGSMQGGRIKNAKQALILFLMSLPQNSFFNIISFGSQFKRMYPQSVKYNKKMLSQTIQKIEALKADMGGTEIAQPLKDIYRNQKTDRKKEYQRHLIILTDGQVSNTNQVIKIIKDMKEEINTTTHMVGIGNGVSYDMIENGAKQGGGQSLFIMETQSLKRQIIYLLQTITSAKINNLKITSNESIIDANSILVPRSLRKGRQITIFMRLKQNVYSEMVKNLQIQLSYQDNQNKNQIVHHKITLEPQTCLPSLDRYKTFLDIANLISSGDKKKAIQQSINNQILCKYTGLICKIKQCALPEGQIKQGYLLKLKNTLEGRSILKTAIGVVQVKTLTGRSVQFTVPLDIMVEDFKCLIYEAEGIPTQQQRMIYNGKHMDNGRHLSDYDIETGAVLHLVLRLRGGDGGSSSNPSNVWILNVKTQSQFFKLPISNDSILLVAQIYEKIYQKFPQIRGIDFKILNKQVELQKQKTLNDYGINASNNQIQMNLPQFYFNILSRVLNLMQVEGYWEFDEDILKKLTLTQVYEKNLIELKENKNLAMTKSIIQYLKTKFANTKDELHLIVKKVNKYLQKNCINQ